MQTPPTRHDVVTAIPTHDPDTVRFDLRKQVYAHHEPPTTGPSRLAELKTHEIDGTATATQYDITTAGWDPEPRYTAFQDNIDPSRLRDQLDTLYDVLTGDTFDHAGRPFIGSLPPAVARKYLTTAHSLILGVITDTAPTATATAPPSAIRLQDLHAGLPDPEPVSLTPAATPSGAPDDATGWLNLSLLTAAWCPVPAPDPGFLHLHPDSGDVAATRTDTQAAVHLHSPTPTRRTMRYRADVDDTAADRFTSLDAERVPIPAVLQRDGDWYVTAAHLRSVISTLLTDGVDVSVTTVIEARDLPTDVRPADAPPLPWHSD
jgi:hypothetical protein